MLAKCAKKLVNVLESIVYILMVSLVIILFSQVCMRYFLGKGFVWAEELSRVAFVWIIFITIAIQVYYQKYLAITFLYDKIKRHQKAAYFVVQCIILVFFVFLTYYGTEYSISGYAKISASLPVRMCWIYMVMPISGVLSIFFIVNDLINTCRNAGEAAK